MSSDPAPSHQSPEPDPVSYVPPAGEGPTPIWPPGTPDLIAVHWPRLRAIAYRVVRDWDVASDLAQEAIYRYLTAPPGYPESTLYKPLLRWLVQDWIRDRKSHPAVALDTAPELIERLVSSGPDALEQVILSDEYRRAREALGQLPKDADLVLRHHLFAEPTKEIANELGVRDGTVRTRIHRAVNQLRAMLEES